MAVDSAPRGRNNEAQANGLGLDYPPILPPALKGRDTCFPMPQSLSPLYVTQQESHHRVVSFQEEFRKLLDAHGIAYDDRYVWD